MTDRVNPHGKVPETGKPPEKEMYDRVLHELTMAVESAAGDSIKDDIPNYKAILQTIKASKNEASRTLPNKSAGKADLVADKYLFENRPYMTRVAPQIKGTAPLGG